MNNWFHKNEQGDIIEFNSIEDFPKDCFGFIYRINNLLNGMFYIGKKQLIFKRKVKLKSRKNKSVKSKESDWKDYWGSSQILLNDIEKYGKENFERIILVLVNTKAEQTYYENYFIYENHNLLNPLCYNKHIGHVYAKNIESKESKILSTSIPKDTREIDDISIIKDYKDGMLLGDICKKYKIGNETLDLIIPKEKRVKNKLLGKHWNKETVNKVKELYNKNYSHQKIAEIANIDHATVRYILINKLGINTKERDLRSKKKSKYFILQETGQIFKEGIKKASKVLKISSYIISKSLKENRSLKGFTFRYI